MIDEYYRIIIVEMDPYEKMFLPVVLNELPSKIESQSYSLYWLEGEEKTKLVEKIRLPAKRSLHLLQPSAMQYFIVLEQPVVMSPVFQIAF